MLSTAIIIFREMLEISLIVGMMLAATRGLSGRLPWIFGGFGLGIAGAGVLAVGTQAISSAMEGVGQELLNAAILFAAATMIGWTALWMRKHAREMSAHMRKIGHDVASGALPHYSLTLVIGLAMLREGAEIALFINGMLLSDQGAASIALGSAIGVVLGSVCGVMLYFGLIKLTTRKMLSLTTNLLLLLVAGMVSQGVGFLTAAGYFSDFTAIVWDSSWLLPDSSLLGKGLHGLIGYSAKPMEIQVIFYAATLALLIATIRWTDRKTMVPVAA